ncbi:MAG TPA: cell division topological specificity factor MinE [Candidatus Tumulicola sp.]
MIDFFRRLFGHSGSSSTAKERLRLVLMTDHLELSPEIVDSMKRDLVDVISRYVEVDREKIDVSFERQDKALAMLANIPIIAVNRASNGHVAEPPVVAPVAAVAPEIVTPAEEEAAAIEPAAGVAPPAEVPAAETAVVAAPSGDAVAPGDLKRRRRRRKRKGSISASSTETVSAN